MGDTITCYACGQPRGQTTGWVPVIYVDGERFDGSFALSWDGSGTVRFNDRPVQAVEPQTLLEDGTVVFALRTVPDVRPPDFGRRYKPGIFEAHAPRTRGQAIRGGPVNLPPVYAHDPGDEDGR